MAGREIIRFADPDPMRRALYLRGDFGPEKIPGGVFRRAVSDKSEIVVMSLAAYCSLVMPPTQMEELIRHESVKVRVLLDNRNLSSAQIDFRASDLSPLVQFITAEKHELDEWQVGRLLRSENVEVRALAAARQRLSAAQKYRLGKDAELQEFLASMPDGAPAFPLRNEIHAIHMELSEAMLQARRDFLGGTC